MLAPGTSVGFSLFFICLSQTIVASSIGPIEVIGLESNNNQIDRRGRGSNNGHSSIKQDANFINKIQNQTVPIRRQAIFDCSVENLVNYKVAWLKLDAINNDTTLLSLDDKIIINDINNDNKFKVMKMLPNQSWRLIINNVQMGDKGYYMCQLSTEPIKYQSAYLDVHIPPNIIDAQTTPNLLQVNEFQRIELKCQAQGYPQPEIEWKKETLAAVNKINGHATNGTTKSLLSLSKGDRFILDRVTRNDAGVYLCIASNKVPPAVSHRISLQVNHGPIVTVKSKIMEGPLGEKVELECQIEGYPPPSDIRWLRSEDQIELSSSSDTTSDTGTSSGTSTSSDHLDNKYQIISYQQLRHDNHHSSYQLPMTISKLIISNLDQQDYGSYQCVASNNVTNRDAFIRLHKPKVSSRYLEGANEQTLGHTDDYDEEEQQQTLSINDHTRQQQQQNHHSTNHGRSSWSQQRRRRPNYALSSWQPNDGHTNNERQGSQLATGQILLVSNDAGSRIAIAQRLLYAAIAFVLGFIGARKFPFL